MRGSPNNLDGQVPAFVGREVCPWTPPTGEVHGAEVCSTGYRSRTDVWGHPLLRPGVGKFFTYQDKARLDSFYASPRVGIDIPVTQSDSISLAAGYLFFTSHQYEFNNWSFYTVYRHRFSIGGERET